MPPQPLLLIHAFVFKKPQKIMTGRDPTQQTHRAAAAATAPYDYTRLPEIIAELESLRNAAIASGDHRTASYITATFTLIFESYNRIIEARHPGKMPL